jgi:drug/metabolite transporter (DMT)-like permease
MLAVSRNDSYNKLSGRNAEAEREEIQPMKNEWLLYVALAGLSWGTYVPLIAYGGKELGGNRYAALLCVGVAYFLIAVLLPLGLFFWGVAPWPAAKPVGLIFSALAGVAGAVGALCVIFAAKSAAGSGAARAHLYIAPLIFGLAPVINTLVSTLWHPEKGEPFNFGFEAPGWKLWVGIVLVGLGAALVLFSKEETESAHKAAHKPTPAATASAESAP